MNMRMGIWLKIIQISKNRIIKQKLWDFTWKTWGKNTDHEDNPGRRLMEKKWHKNSIFFDYRTHRNSPEFLCRYVRVPKINWPDRVKDPTTTTITCQHKCSTKSEESEMSVLSRMETKADLQSLWSKVLFIIKTWFIYRQSQKQSQNVLQHCKQF